MKFFHLDKTNGYKKHINFNKRKRNLRENDFEKEFYQLPNSALYGETMENVRNWTKVEFILKRW